MSSIPRNVRAGIKGIWLLLILTFLPYYINGQAFIYQDQPPFTPDTQIEDLYEQVDRIADSIAKRDQNVIYRAYIFEIDTLKYLLINGRNDVFRLNDSMENVSKSSFHGYNFKSKKFVWKDTIFSYGGYGFWRRHGDLIYFDWDRKEWEICVIPGNYEGVVHWKTFQTDSLLYTYAGEHIEQGKGYEQDDHNLHRIDLNAMEYENLGPVSEKLRDLKPPFIFYETKDFHVFQRSGNKSCIIDKDALEFKMTNLEFQEEMRSLQGEGLYHITGNRVTLFDSIGTAHGSVDVVKAYQEMNGKPMSIIPESEYWSIRMLGVALFVLVGAIVYIWMRRQSELDFEHPIIKDLCKHDGEVLSVEELDELFDISDIRQNETKRAKRANYIKEINLEYQSKKGKELIERKRDPEDQRRFIYRINC